ncbi:hypothetical protein EFZ62_16160 [Serratia marcescens]|uniref:hypothetical protein n=1 Tax=Serratia marcescens TaxID=615 RepID=UPI001316FC83|nr:hypothetical protein [Serratia marcescens]QHC46414.1 hypothetical protein EFZ62_16160 [Serratia marcescens]
MTQTLTTEWLKERLKNPRTGTEFELINEVLANREAQPVTEPYMYELWKWDETVPDLDRWFLVERSREKLVAGKQQKVVCLYTAPPAPAVPDDLIMQVRRLVHALKKSNPEHALVKQVPDYMRRAGYWKLTDCLRDHDACRAAMLAQPVSGGYTLPDGFKLMPLEMTDEIGEAIAMEARCCGGIALCIYEAALAAAPEGGNG